MARTVHVIGNGDNARMYQQNSKGLKVTCNIPPFPVQGAYGTCIVDFKMCKAMAEQSLTVPGDWIMGFRPHKFLEMNPNIRIRWAQNIKEFYLDLPKYAGNYTNFNCGHFAVHYSCNKLKADELHMYGFDSIFDLNLRSCTDFYLGSDRGDGNNVRLTDNWRPLWHGIFNEFKNTKFVLHHKHPNIKIQVPDNVEIVTK